MSRLKNHAKKHNADFMCNQCEQKFTTKNNLDKHVSAHTKERIENDANPTPPTLE